MEKYNGKTCIIKSENGEIWTAPELTYDYVRDNFDKIGFFVGYGDSEALIQDKEELEHFISEEYPIFQESEYKRDEIREGINMFVDLVGDDLYEMQKVATDQEEIERSERQYEIYGKVIGLIESAPILLKLLKEHTEYLENLGNEFNPELIQQSRNILNQLNKLNN